MQDTTHYFNDIFENAKVNAILVMSEDGIVDRVNGAFTTAFGYTTEDLHAKHFRLLFIEKDQLTRRPEIELNTTHREGACTDENYLVHKNGTRIWVTGESILVKTAEKPCIVKIIHNIHAQKQLERYLLNTSELLESLFESVPQSGLLLLNNQMKLVKANSPFKALFNITEPITEGARLQQLNHPFWSSEELKEDIRKIITHNMPIEKTYVTGNESSAFRKLHITSKTITSHETGDKQILLVIQEA